MTAFRCSVSISVYYLLVCVQVSCPSILFHLSARLSVRVNSARMRTLNINLPPYRSAGWQDRCFSPFFSFLFFPLTPVENFSTNKKSEDFIRDKSGRNTRAWPHPGETKCLTKCISIHEQARIWKSVHVRMGCKHVQYKKEKDTILSNRRCLYTYIT